jgi:hypothetical protein
MLVVRSRSWVLSILSSPTAKGIHCDALAPDGLRVLLLRGNICLSCSWLHSLKIWSLLKTRGDSMRKNSGSHFEPRLVELFENILPSILAIKETWAKKESHWKIPA